VGGDGGGREREEERFLDCPSPKKRKKAGRARKVGGGM